MSALVQPGGEAEAQAVGRVVIRPVRRGATFGSVVVPYLYLAPGVLLVAGLVGFCIYFTINTSFYRWNGIGSGAIWIGLANYQRLLSDPVVLQSIVHSALMALTIPVTMLLGLLFAALLHSRVILKPLYKALLFLPVVLSPAIMAPTFREIFSNDGPLNEGLRAVGLGGLAQPWLADPNSALGVLMIIAIWSGTGFSFLLYYAALTAIDSEMLEAARIDGASNWTIFFRFLVPLTWPTAATLVLLGLISTMKVFDLPFLITSGGPAHSTEFLSTYLLSQALKNFNAGYGAAIAVVMIAICIGLALVQLRQVGKAQKREARA